MGTVEKTFRAHELSSLVRDGSVKVGQTVKIMDSSTRISQQTITGVNGYRVTTQSSKGSNRIYYGNGDSEHLLPSEVQSYKSGGTR